MKNRVIFGHKTIIYSVIRSKRRKKTISIFIEPTKEILVRAPVNASYSRLNRVVKSKAKWITKKLRLLDDTSLPIKREFVSGESFSYLGRYVRLKILKNNKNEIPVVKMQRGRLEVSMNKANENGAFSEEVRNAIIEWFKIKGAKRIPDRVNIYTKKMGLPEPKIFIRNQQKIWGSCDTKGVLRFNWRMIMAPVSIIDYVVVHELCHLKYNNHSKDFWKYLGMIMPDYEKRRERLKREGSGWSV